MDFRRARRRQAIFFPRNTGREPLHFTQCRARAVHRRRVGSVIKTATALRDPLDAGDFLLGACCSRDVGVLAAAIIGVSRGTRSWPLGERTSYLPAPRAPRYFLLKALRDRRRSDSCWRG